LEQIAVYDPGTEDLAPDEISVRMAAVDEEIWPTDPTRPKETAEGVGDSFSDFTKSGKEPMTELVNQVYADFNEANGTDIQIEKL
jgi:hypothetical protein